MFRPRPPGMSLHQTWLVLWLCVLTLDTSVLMVYASGLRERLLSEREGHGMDFLSRQAWHYEPSTPHHILDRSRAFTGDDSRMKVRDMHVLFTMVFTRTLVHKQKQHHGHAGANCSQCISLLRYLRHG